MELMRFPLENTHSRRGYVGWRGCESGVAEEGEGAGEEGGGEGGGGKDRSQSFFFFSSRGNVSRGQEWYESRGLVSSRDGPRDSIGQM